MNIEHLLCTPVAWTEKVFPNVVREEYSHLLSFFHGRIVEVFCRGGRWGEILIANGHSWSGMDTDTSALEQAFLRGLFDVKVGLLPSEKSCDMIFAPTSPFSRVSHEDCAAFVNGIYEALSQNGTVLLSFWEEPTTQLKKPLMYTYNGVEKLVMACSVDMVENRVILDMEWMNAKEGQEPYFVTYQEERFLHYIDDVRHYFVQLFGHVEVRSIAGRRWLFAKKL